MRIPLQLAVIFAICIAGEVLHRVVGVPLPGNIIGMVLLLILLCTKVIKPEHISGVSSFFLKYLALRAERLARRAAQNKTEGGKP